MKVTTQKKTQGHTLIRMPGYLKEALKQRAEKNHRSITGEVTHIVEQHLKQDAMAEA